MRLSCAARIRRTAYLSGGGGGGAQEEGSSASLPSTAWHGFYVFRRIAPTLSKNVILAEFSLYISYHYKSRYLTRLNTFFHMFLTV